MERVANPAHRRSSPVRPTAAGTAVPAREDTLNRRVGGAPTDAEVRACVRVPTGVVRTIAHVGAG
ncbi:hypothetical protein SZN_23886 [Streptomyces zinciresistens K42]|uniref:Uncharacterized protein n=1 Tax=Streptomyces zinciresistens K42 TaxID=700597 RepID=G2GGZ3_9ACTN|nr:hypothetical protein [Streptomyces zinciresistens]EGX57241.1 hypothetical protein SZN_23886 [Streptomyces zinciresistens K42]